MLGHDEKKCKASVAVMEDNGRGGLTRLYGLWIFTDVYSRTWWKEGKRKIPSPPAMSNVEEIAQWVAGSGGWKVGVGSLTYSEPTVAEISEA